jgi:hypothetical protein
MRDTRRFVESRLHHSKHAIAARPVLLNLGEPGGFDMQYHFSGNLTDGMRRPVSIGMR